MKDSSNSINRGYLNVNDDSIFMRLDTLINKNIIKHEIGIIHLDVEGMEDKAILGGINYIQKKTLYIIKRSQK